MPVNPLNAYHDVEKATLSGRDLEAMILTRAANMLQDVKNHWAAEDRSARLDAALRYNQKVWSLFQAELTGTENTLPAQVKSNLLNLSAFVDRRTFEVIAYPDANKLEILITINKNIASGLRGESSAATGA